MIDRNRHFVLLPMSLQLEQSYGYSAYVTLTECPLTWTFPTFYRHFGMMHEYRATGCAVVFNGLGVLTCSK